MNYVVATHKRVDKFLSKHKDVAKRFTKLLDVLEEDPFSKKLDSKRQQ